MAKKEIRTNPHLYAGDNLAGVGIILGWIGLGLAILVVCLMLAGFILPFILSFLVLLGPLFFLAGAEGTS